MLLDEVYIEVTAGKGGDGFVHFHSNRHSIKGGPDGGDGGDGGSVYFQAENDISLLNQFRNKKKYEAQNGGVGGKNNKIGKRGDDLVLKVPLGTIISYDNGDTIELNARGEKVIVAKGGTGGFGNTHFKSPENTTPRNCTPGFAPKTKRLFLQLKLIADIGFIGLPNAGKSSLLNELTSASAKVANYPFTTLEPNLGVTRSGHIIADIPGLIEGASGGKGLGFKFLKHVERTKVIVHCISSESQSLMSDYTSIRKELENYSTLLAAKKEIVILTKSDLLSAQDIEKKLKETNAVLAVSVLDEESIKKLSAVIDNTISS